MTTTRERVSAVPPATGANDASAASLHVLISRNQRFATSHQRLCSAAAVPAHIDREHMDASSQELRCTS